MLYLGFARGKKIRIGETTIRYVENRGAAEIVLAIDAPPEIDILRCDATVKTQKEGREHRAKTSTAAARPAKEPRPTGTANAIRAALDATCRQWEIDL